MLSTPEKYNVILADPPWKIQAGRKLTGYKTIANKQVFIPKENIASMVSFPTLSLEQIKSLPVSALSADNAHLYLWATNKHLPLAYEVVSSWGFKYSTTLVWAKNRFGGGLGGTYRINTEFLLFATKGKLKANKTNPATWYNVKRTYINGYPKHSKKPDFFYELIESTSPGNKLELFARNKRTGWDAWGNEIDSDIFIPVKDEKVSDQSENRNAVFCF
jgi:N6-adenosine-specific RNA methylase IME4